MSPEKVQLERELHPKPLIDPRLLERRLEVRRRQGRRRLRIATSVTAAVSLALIGWGVLRSPVLDVDEVRLVGLPGQRTSSDDVVMASATLGRPLVEVRESAVARRVERLPWVATAVVRRRWPATVEVTITERSPVALVEAPSGGARLLVDADGRVLATTRGQERLPLVVTAGSARPGQRLPAAARPLVAVAAGIRPALGAHLTAVSAADEPGTVELRLRTGGVAHLGPADEIGPKLAAVEAVLAQVDLTGLAVLDVRVPTSPVLTRTGASTKVSTAITG